MPWRMHLSAIDRQIADFPAPAAPLSHAIQVSRAIFSRIHSKISSRTASRVCSWHRGASHRCFELWKADAATCPWSIWKPSLSADWAKRLGCQHASRSHCQMYLLVELCTKLLPYITGWSALLKNSVVCWEGDCWWAGIENAGIEIRKEQWASTSTPADSQSIYGRYSALITNISLPVMPCYLHKDGQYIFTRSWVVESYRQVQNISVGYSLSELNKSFSAQPRPAGWVIGYIWAILSINPNNSWITLN